MKERGGQLFNGYPPQLSLSWRESAQARCVACPNAATCCMLDAPCGSMIFSRLHTLFFFFFFLALRFCLVFTRFWWKKWFSQEAMLSREKHSCASPKREKHSMCFYEKNSCASARSTSLLPRESTSCASRKRKKRSICASTRSTTFREKHNCASPTKGKSTIRVSKRKWKAQLCFQIFGFFLLVFIPFPFSPSFFGEKRVH